MNQLEVIAQTQTQHFVAASKKARSTQKQKSQGKKEVNNNNETKPKATEFPKLTWLDFRARPQSDSHFYAHSYWRISYSYSVILRGNQAKVNMNAKCIFEKDRSWAKPELKSKDLLEHEQGHYYIGCLCALTLKKKVNSAIYTKTNYKSEIQKIFKENFDEFITLEKRYDEETHHFLDQEVQKRWDKFLNKSIKDLKNYWWI